MHQLDVFAAKIEASTHLHDPPTHAKLHEKRQNLSTSWTGASELPVNSWTSPYIFFVAENVSFVLCDVESYMLYL